MKQITRKFHHKAVIIDIVYRNAVAGNTARSSYLVLIMTQQSSPQGPQGIFHTFWSKYHSQEGHDLTRCRARTMQVVPGLNRLFIALKKSSLIMLLW